MAEMMINGGKVIVSSRGSHDHVGFDFFYSGNTFNLTIDEARRLAYLIGEEIEKAEEAQKEIFELVQKLGGVQELRDIVLEKEGRVRFEVSL